MKKKHFYTLCVGLSVYMRSSHNRKTGFYANRDLNKQEVGLIFALSGSEL
jgi:hypothetical protein